MPQIDIEGILSRLQTMRKEANPPQEEVDLELSAEDITESVKDSAQQVQKAVQQTKKLPESTKTIISEDDEQLPLQLRGLNIDIGMSRARIIEQLVTTTPLNEYNLPAYIYRADLINPEILAGIWLSTARTRNRDLLAYLDSAIEYLNYSEGFPTIQGGMPFWSKLPYESDESYQAFMSYLEMGGARALHQLIAYNMGDLNQWFHMFYWSARVKSFDLFRIANHQKVRIQRMLLTEDSHYMMAEQLMRKVRPRLDNLTQEELESIPPHKALEMIEKLVKIQRISVGLPANGQSDSGKTSIPKVPSVEILMQEAAEESAPIKDSTDQVDILMEDTESLEMAQKLVIKMGSSR